MRVRFRMIGRDPPGSAEQLVMMHLKSAFKMAITVQLCESSLAKKAKLTLQKYATRVFSAASCTVLVHRGLEARTLSAVRRLTLAARVQDVKIGRC